MKAGRVIVTYGRSLMSLVIAQSLSRRGVEVIGCDDVDLTVMSFSQHVSKTFVHPVAVDDEEGFLSVMAEKVRAYKPKDDRPYLLMPVFRNTDLIARNRRRFEPDITVAAPDSKSISKIFPKQALAATALEAGIGIPKTIHAAGAETLAEKLASFRTPLMLKPVAGVGGQGIEIYDDCESAIAAHQEFLHAHGEPPLIQEKVEGDDYCFTGLFKNGRLMAHMAYRNLKSFPRKAGAGAIRETVDDQVFIEPVKKLMGETGWTGVAEIDFLWSGDRKDKPWLIEVNPRFWAGLFHSIKSGVDFPWLLYELFTTGEISRSGEAQVGETTKTPGLWLASVAQEIAESDIRFDKLSAAWAANVNGGLTQKASNVYSAFGDALNLDDACFRILETFDLAKDSSGEFQEYDDPYTGLGILFVLSSLVRHGRLPEEIKY